MPLVDVDGEQRELEGRAALDLAQQVEQCVRVFAAADRDHYAVARFDQPKVVAGVGDFGEQPFFLGDPWVPGGVTRTTAAGGHGRERARARRGRVFA